MNGLEKTKVIFGIILLFFTTIFYLVLFLEAFDIMKYGTLDTNLSDIFESKDSSSNAPIFMGLCGLAGAYLLSGVKLKKKNDESEEA
ncbi:MAG: hypothetical protein DA407_05405 [Bacteroidetes bacterium]|nr:MAG: hypothetical protein DA407_05405 [Bacteroidota bacterium]